MMEHGVRVRVRAGDSMLTQVTSYPFISYRYTPLAPDEMLRRANEKPDVLLVDDNLCVHTDARFG